MVSTVQQGLNLSVAPLDEMVRIPEEVLLQGNRMKKKELTPLATSIAEKIVKLASCLFGKKEIPELELLRQLVEHHEYTLEQFVMILYAGQFTTQNSENSDRICASIRDHFSEVREILGEKRAKKFLYLMIFHDCYSNHNNFSKWQECIRKEYGVLGEELLVCDRVVEKTEDFIASILDKKTDIKNVQFDIPCYLRSIQQLFSELQEHPLGVKRISWHLFLQSLTEHVHNIKGQIQELKRFPSMYGAFVGAGWHFPTRDIMDEFRIEKKMMKRLEQLVCGIERLMVALKEYHQRLSLRVDTTSSYEKNPFIHLFGGIQEHPGNKVALKDVPEKMYRSRVGKWDVSANFKEMHSLQARWKGYQARISEVLDTIVPEDFLRDISRVSFFFGGEAFRIPSIGGHNITPDKVFKYNLALQGYLKNTFQWCRKQISASQLALLRYQLQDVAQQGIFNADQQFLRKIMAEYQEAGLHAHDATCGVQYHIWVCEGMITLKAEVQVAVHKESEKEKPAIGYEALEIFVTLDVARYDSAKLLTEQEVGVVRGDFRRSGFIQASSLVV